MIEETREALMEASDLRTMMIDARIVIHGILGRLFQIEPMLAGLAEDPSDEIRPLSPKPSEENAPSVMTQGPSSSVSSLGQPTGPDGAFDPPVLAIRETFNRMFSNLDRMNNLVRQHQEEQSKLKQTHSSEPSSNEPKDSASTGAPPSRRISTWRKLKKLARWMLKQGKGKEEKEKGKETEEPEGTD
jgi:hypothetical protein